MKCSPGRARSHMTTKPVSVTLQRPLPLKARDSHTSSRVWPRFGKNELGLGMGGLGSTSSAREQERVDREEA